MTTSPSKLLACCAVIAGFTSASGQTLLRNAKLQGDMDANGHQILNLGGIVLTNLVQGAITVLGEQSNTIATALQPGATNALGIIITNQASLRELGDQNTLAQALASNAVLRAAITNETSEREAAVAALIGSNTLVQATIDALEVECDGGWMIDVWWDPVLSAIYRGLTPPVYSVTNGHIISDVALSEIGFLDYRLGMDVVAGFPGEAQWSLASTTTASIVSNVLVAASPGKATLSGVAGGVTRTITVPISYALVGETVTTVSGLLPGSPAALASDPIVGLASNYLATTTEPLVWRPNSWSTNETFRTNYAAVAYWQSPPVWNPDCWLTNAPAVFSCTAIATGSSADASPAWNGTLIAPRVILHARHTGSEAGKTKWFLTPSGDLTNAVVAATIDPWAGTSPLRPDILLGYLDRPMPTNMVALVATNEQWDASFAAPAIAQYVTGVAFNQHLEASIIEFASIGSFVSFRPPSLPATQPLADLYHAAHPGDSGRPVFVLWGQRPVLTCVYWTAMGGAGVGHYAADIEAALVSYSQSLTYVDFEESP